MAAIQKIADNYNYNYNYNLKVIYDAAHAFGVQDDGGSVLGWATACGLAMTKKPVIASDARQSTHPHESMTKI